MPQHTFYRWQDILTSPDESLVGEGSIDPMGMQIIWSDFGQRIFNYRLTTVSNDVRNYTLNLFHHHVIRILGKNDPGFFHNAVKKFAAFRTESDVKAGILILLEDLLAHLMVFMKFELNENVNLEGILGTNKAEHQYFNDKDSIRLEAEKTKGVLVKQIALGINGRYKGPFMSMGLLSSRYFDYDEETWRPIEQLFANWDTAAKLAVLLTKILSDLFYTSKDSYPSVQFVMYRNNSLLRELYMSAFGDMTFTEEVKLFWEGKIGLTEGSSKALYRQMELPDSTYPHIIFQEAANQITDQVEREKITDIIKLEPFLSVCSQLFYRMTDPSSRYLDSLKSEAEVLMDYTNLKELIPLTNSNTRLQLLVEYFIKGTNDPIETLRQIVNYHEEVMEQRGNHPWIEIVKEGKIKHFTYQEARFRTEEYSEMLPWYHTYYLPTLRSIFKELRGKS